MSDTLSRRRWRCSAPAGWRRVGAAWLIYTWENATSRPWVTMAHGVRDDSDGRDAFRRDFCCDFPRASRR